MKLLHAYRLALVEGLTAKQAGAKFNLNHQSLAKCKNRYNLPSLRNEWDAVHEDSLKKLSDKQLLSYAESIKKNEHAPKHNQSKREIRVLKQILESRNLRCH